MLWLIENIDSLDPEAVLALLPRLSPARREKTLRYKVQPPKLQSILAELLLRYALKQESDIRELPEIAVGEKGKPFFPAHPELHFNLSHCKTAVACALDSSPVGVDVQEIRFDESGEVYPRSSLMRGIYSEAEKAWVLAGETEVEQERRFIAVWTCKEAYGKAIGEGILYPLTEFSFLPRQEVWKQLDFSFQTQRRGESYLTLCAQEPLAIQTVSFSELTAPTAKPDAEEQNREDPRNTNREEKILCLT